MPTFTDPTPPVVGTTPTPPPPPPPTPPSTPPPSGSGGGGGAEPSAPRRSRYPTWRIELFDLLGNQLYDLSEPAFSPQLTYPLNGFDQLSFSVYLDDAAARYVHPLTTVVKVWHDMPGGAPSARGNPVFAGVVGPSSRQAAARTATYNVFSPLWRLQFRHHIDPHDFTVETGVGSLVSTFIPDPDDPSSFIEADTGGLDPSDIMWRMINFTQNLVVESTNPPFGAVALTAGIVQGSFADYGGAVVLDKKYDRGQNTWDLINDIVNIPGMPDLAPSYFHNDGDPNMMAFNTAIKRGVVRDPGSFSLDYRRGNKNLDDLTEDTPAEPGTFATYVVIQGQDGTNGTQTIVRADGVELAVPFSNGNTFWTPPDEIDQYGLYIYFQKLGNFSTDEQRRALGQYLLSRYMNPPTTLTPTLSPALVWDWPNSFHVGDVVTVTCDRDAMQVNAAKRITQLTVSQGADGAETFTLKLEDDWDDITLT